MSIDPVTAIIVLKGAIEAVIQALKASSGTPVGANGLGAIDEVVTLLADNWHFLTEEERTYLAGIIRWGHLEFARIKGYPWLKRGFANMKFQRKANKRLREVEEKTQVARGRAFIAVVDGKLTTVADISNVIVTSTSRRSVPLRQLHLGRPPHGAVNLAIANERERWSASPDVDLDISASPGVNNGPLTVRVSQIIGGKTALNMQFDLRTPTVSERNSVVPSLDVASDSQAEQPQNQALDDLASLAEEGIQAAATADIKSEALTNFITLLEALYASGHESGASDSGVRDLLVEILRCGMEVLSGNQRAERR